MDAHGAILASADDSLVAETNAVHGAGVADHRPLMLASARVPDLHCLVLCTADNTQRVGGKRPDALHVAEEAVDASARRYVPEANCTIERTSKHVGWWTGSRWVVREHSLFLNG